MPRIGNESQMRPIELPQEEHIGLEVPPQVQQTNHQELEHPVRATSSPSTQAAEKAISAQAQQSQLNRQLLENRANAIHQACAGIGTDEATVFRNLSGLSSEERRQLDDIYRQKFGMSLEQQIRDEMSGPELDQALALLHARPANQDLERPIR